MVVRLVENPPSAGYDSGFSWNEVTDVLTIVGGIVTPAIGPASTRQHALPAVASDIVALVAAAQTLANKTLTAPTIADYTNAQHAHTDAVSGGTVTPRVTVRKNTGADVGTRRRLNLIEGSNVTLTIADDSAGEEIDITIAASGGTAHNLLSATHPDTVAAAVAAGDIVTGNATPAWARLARGTAGTVLKAGSSVLAWGQVAFSELTGTLATAQITDNAVDNAKLRDSAALSVIGRAADTTGDPADISAGTDNTVLRRSGAAIGFGQIPFSVLTGALGTGQHGALSDGDHTGALSGNARVVVRKNTGSNIGARRRLNLIEGSNITLTVEDDSAAEEVDVTITAVVTGGTTHNLLSATHPDTVAAAVVAGDLVTGNATPAWERLARGTAGTVLKSGASVLAWGQVAFSEVTGTLATAQIADNAVTNAKLRDSAALSVIGRSADTVGDPLDIAAGTDGNVLRRSGTAIGFGTVATAGLADAVITGVKLATGPRKRTIVLVVPGNPAAGAMVSIQVAPPHAGTITAIKSTCRAAATADYTYDINKNGTTIYSTQANRPIRTGAAGTALVSHTLPNVTSLTTNDLFMVDLDTAGTGISDMTFLIEYEVT